MSPINAKLQAVRARIEAASHATNAGSRRIRPVTLIAVSKTQPAALVRDAFAAGQRVFGENYVQEAVAKQAELADLAIEWHFIGPIQSNKTRLIAGHFDWVHGVERMKVAEMLSRHRGESHPGDPLNVLVQVNVSGEATKRGVVPAEAAELVRAAASLANIRMRGLMTLIENVTDPEAQRAQFRMLRELFDRIRAAGTELDTLSMGMTQDFEVAIAEGATLVRIGTALFGARTPKEAA
ncbi:MAG: YggS family pyridoxal phosphate-dependent enzyme [Betaproteobacteria bacterium]|nr:YggS family pyridoxal phosphate-dependent enzyme [Betaproteobacteria bacterium]